MKKMTIMAIVLSFTALEGRGEIFTLTDTPPSTIVQSFDLDSFSSGKQLYLNPFDVSLGHLLKIAFTWTLNSEITAASITNQNADAVNAYTFDLSNTVQAYLSSGGASGAPLFSTTSPLRGLGGGLLGPGDSYTVSDVMLPENNYNAALQSLVVTPYTTFDNSSLTAFMGADAVPIYLTNTFAITSTVESVYPSWQKSASGSTSGHLNVYYSYVGASTPVAAVPEPHSLILGGVGIAGMSVLLFRRGTKKSSAKRGEVSEGKAA